MSEGDEKMLVDSKWSELELRCNYVIKNQKTRQIRFPWSIHETKKGSSVETRSLLSLPRISSGEELLAATNERALLVRLGRRCCLDFSKIQGPI